MADISSSYAPSPAMLRDNLGTGSAAGGLAYPSINDDFMTDDGDEVRAFIISVELSEKVTENGEAYTNLVNAIQALHDSELIRPSDFVLYNIGSPLEQAYLACD